MTDEPIDEHANTTADGTGLPEATGASEADAPQTEAPEAETSTSDSRARLLIALPLVIALVAAGLLLWTRTSPSSEGGFCTRGTREITTILHAGEGSGRIDYNRTQQVDEALKLAYLADVSKLLDGAPASLRRDLERAEELLPAYRAARAEAERTGSPTPEPSQELQDTLTAFVAAYYETCI